MLHPASLRGHQFPSSTRSALEASSSFMKNPQDWYSEEQQETKVPTLRKLEASHSSTRVSSLDRVPLFFLLKFSGATCGTMAYSSGSIALPCSLATVDAGRRLPWPTCSIASLSCFSWYERLLLVSGEAGYVEVEPCGEGGGTGE